MDLEPASPASSWNGPARRLLVRVIVGAAVLVALMALVVSLALAISSTFPDVPVSHPYHDAILDLAGRGVLNGFPDGNFRPDSPVLRQQFAKMIVLALGYAIPAGIVCPFTDVDLTPNPLDPFYPAKYVAVCAYYGITTGKTPTTFDPYGDITLQQLITMVVRAAALPDPPDSYVPPFLPTDFYPEEHYLNARKAAYAGLLARLERVGIGHTINVQGPSTRGECAQLLHDLIVLLTPPTTTTSTAVSNTTTTTTSSSTTTTTSSTTTTTGATTTTSSSTTTTTAPALHHENLGGILSSGPGVASWGVNRLDVFVRGADNASLEHKYWSGSSWSEWENPPSMPTMISAPAAVSWGPNRIDVFALGWDHNIWHIWFSDGIWTGPESLGGPFYAGPAAASWGVGRLDVFTRDSDDALRHAYWNGSWSAWENLGGVLDSDPAAVSWGPDRIDVFWRETDNAIWTRAWTGSSWSAPQSMGGTLYQSSSPAVASMGPGLLNVFCRGASDTLYMKSWDGSSGFGWVDMGQVLDSDPDAVSWGPNRIDVFWRGLDASLQHRWWDGVVWLP